MKTYIGTKQVKAEPMNELAAVEKERKVTLARTRTTTNGVKVITCSTPIRTAAPTTLGRLSLSLSKPTSVPTASSTACR